MIQTYLQTGNITGITNIPIIKRMIDESVRRNKKEDKKQKTTMFKVNLIYSSSSEQFKVKAKSFFEANGKAFARKKSNRVPKRVIVRKIAQKTVKI